MRHQGPPRAHQFGDPRGAIGDSPPRLLDQDFRSRGGDLAGGGQIHVGVDRGALPPTPQ